MTDDDMDERIQEYWTRVWEKAIAEARAEVRDEVRGEARGVAKVRNAVIRRYGNKVPPDFEFIFDDKELDAAPPRASAKGVQGTEL